MRDDPDTFIQIVRHVSLRQVDADRIANTTRRALQRDPSDAPTAYWRWVAIGPQALPMVRQMYDYPEALPRLASLRAGAALKDPVAAESLRKMAADGMLAEQLEAAHLLAQLPSDPRTEEVLRSMLDNRDVEVRLRAYEALEQLGSPFVRRDRIPGKFELHQVPSAWPAIYVTQARFPRLVLLGETIEIERPLTLGLWENSLMMHGIEDDEEIEIFHRADPSHQAIINRTEPDLRDVILLLAHEPTIENPSPGLALTYSQVVGVLHALWKEQYVDADFKAQQDRVLAELRRGAMGTERQARPE